MQNGEPLKVFTLVREGALKNIATIFQEKLSLHGYGVDLCEFYDKKGGPEICLGLKGRPQNFAMIFVCIRPPLQVLVNSP